MRGEFVNLVKKLLESDKALSSDAWTIDVTAQAALIILASAMADLYEESPEAAQAIQKIVGSIGGKEWTEMLKLIASKKGKSLEMYTKQIMDKTNLKATAEKVYTDLAEKQLLNMEPTEKIATAIAFQLLGIGSQEAIDNSAVNQVLHSAVSHEISGEFMDMAAEILGIQLQ
jgi:hypothetical protein